MTDPMPDNPKFNAALGELQYCFISWCLKQPWAKAHLAKIGDSHATITSISQTQNPLDVQLEVTSDLPQTA
jgi:hypothetical protein